MKLNKTTDILLNVALPLALGILIYHAASFCAVPAFIRNYFPDGCWAYAFLSGMLIIWDRKLSIPWIILVFITAAAYEWLQFIHVLPGTGDIGDVADYFVFFILALTLNPRFKTHA
jgi:hypothetical protein